MQRLTFLQSMERKEFSTPPGQGKICPMMENTKTIRGTTEGTNSQLANLIKALSGQGMNVDNDATDGKDAGDVWLFVQDANVDTLKRLKISVSGGRRVKGVDSSSQGVSGSNGKAAGN